MADTNHAAIDFKLDPVKTPVYLVDTTLIASNNYVVTLNFAQTVLNTKQQQIVSRVALSISQAKSLLKDLNDHIEKYER